MTYVNYEGISWEFTPHADTPRTNLRLIHLFITQFVECLFIHGCKDLHSGIWNTCVDGLRATMWETRSKMETPGEHETDAGATNCENVPEKQ